MKVYKYTPHIELFLENSALKLTPIKQLNDPFESIISENLLLEFENKFKDTPFKDNPKILENIIEYLKDNGRYKGVISLSSAWNNILMLSHYADEHKGGILEFTIPDISNDYQNKNDFLTSSDKIDYALKRVNYIKEHPEKLPYDFNEFLSYESFFNKHNSWSYEKEVRYLADFRRSDYFIIPKSEIRRCKTQLFATQDPNEKEIDILTRLFKDCILDIYEVSDSIFLELKEYEDSASIESIQKFFKLETLINSGMHYHPIVKINPDKLTGIYLGCKNDSNISLRSVFDKFKNLTTVQSGCISYLDYTINYTNYSDAGKSG